MWDGAGGEGGIHLLLSILADGEEQARQLAELPGAEHDDLRGAARRLQSSLGKAVSVAKAIEAASGSSRGTDRSDSPRSADESSGGTGTAVEAQAREGVCKRRKGLPRWTSKFRVPDANLEATPDDGFIWRKYGQKDILGAKFPRGYYRCTYRAAQGCPATKQVQRSDSDLCVFDITYQGVHTCHQKQRHASTASYDISQPRPQGLGVELLTGGFNDCLKMETVAPPPPLHASHDDRDHGAAAGSAPSASFSFQAFSSSAGPSYGYSVPRCLVAGSYGYEYELPAGARMRGAESSELGEVVSRATAPSAPDLSAAPARLDYSLYHHGEFDLHLPFGGHYH